MTSLETRNVTRDSLFLFAEIVLEAQPQPVRVKVRNLSAGGMMTDGGDLAVSRGERLIVKLRNIGDVKGSVAWVQGTRFGVIFDNEIDPKVARAPLADGEHSPRYTRPPVGTGKGAPDGFRVRNI